jgi:hypothetical protein
VILVPEVRVHSVGLLSLALLVLSAPAAAAEKLQRGDELAYAGTIMETVNRPGTRLRRMHRLEVRVLILERRDSWADAAVLTLLKRADDTPVTGALPEVTGANRGGTAPPAARLDIVRIHDDGTVHLLAPPGPPPIRLTADAPARSPPSVPLDTFAPFEFGMFPPRRNGAATTWSVAPDDRTRPTQRWTFKEHDFIDAERCTHLAMVQESAEWAKPIGGQTSWQRVDDVWMSEAGAARRVHRIIRQRDGVAPAAAIVVETKYELKEKGRPMDRTYDRYRQEIETAYLAAAEMTPLLKEARRLGPEPFNLRIARLDAHLEATEPGTPYREAVQAVRRQLEAARRGEAVLVPDSTRELPVLPAQASPIGRPAPDFQTGEFKLSDTQGKPVVLIFFMPGVESADQSLAIGEAIRKKYGSRVAVAPLAVFGGKEAGTRDRDRLKLSILVYDGTSASPLYGVESFPRFYAIDGAGKVHWSFEGVGNETGYLLREQLESLLSPPVATSSPVGSWKRRMRPRP